MDFELIQDVAGKLELLSFVEGAATIGFDGFTDEIVRVVSGVAADRTPVHFESKRAFGEKMIELGSSNASYDLTAVATKIGGNAPNTAHALGRLGLQVDCIGMLGYPRIDELFAGMDPNCTLHSFAQPTHTTALEFDDGKVLLASSALLATIDWPTVRDRIGIEQLAELYSLSDVIGFVNWGEIPHATEIWEGIEREVLPNADPLKSRIVVFDLADPTKRDRDFDSLVALIGRLSGVHETVLCLNRNEAQAMARQLGIEQGSRPEALGAAIYASITVDTLVIRDPHSAMAWTSKGLSTAGTFHVAAPRLSTGGGDNFNAGYCFARLAGLDTQSSLVVASAVAGLYVATGESPSRSDVIAFLKQKSAAALADRVAGAAQ
jgi:sugar/nucleoside kinase (ribokinase family)